MASGFTYKEKDLLGGWQIEVRKGRAHIGNIRRSPSGGFQYFSGPNNQLNWSLKDDSLDDLKKKIEAKN